MNFKQMKTMEKKEYMQPQIEAGNLLDNSVTRSGVTFTPGAAGEEVAGGEVNSKLHIDDVWE